MLLYVPLCRVKGCPTTQPNQELQGTELIKCEKDFPRMGRAGLNPESEDWCRTEVSWTSGNIVPRWLFSLFVYLQQAPVWTDMDVNCSWTWVQRNKTDNVTLICFPLLNGSAILTCMRVHFIIISVKRHWHPFYANELNTTWDCDRKQDKSHYIKLAVIIEKKISLGNNVGQKLN